MIATGVGLFYSVSAIVMIGHVVFAIRNGLESPFKAVLELSTSVAIGILYCACGVALRKHRFAIALIAFVACITLPVVTKFAAP